MQKKPGFWRRLERSIRKRRKRLQAWIGFDRKWYLRKYPDVESAGVDPLSHYIQHGKSEGRFKNQKQENSFLSLRTAKKPRSHSGVTTYDSQNWDLDPAGKRKIPRIEFEPSHSLPVPYQKHKSIEPTVKLIAFYLPQFHPFPENDLWWGKDFTEWTNVRRATPNFPEHHQPRRPIHLEYYDLRRPGVMEEQVALAKNYGIHGFSYYFYWFGGKRLMEGPLLAMLKNKNIDMPFCLTWANENWTRKWDGQENEVLIRQQHNPDDSRAFIRHLFQYFKDPRYLNVSGSPILIIYRANIIPNIRATTALWRSEAVKAGFPGLYLISAQTFDIHSPKPFDFDAAVEFPPHGLSCEESTHKISGLCPSFRGRIYNYEQAVSRAVRKPEPDYKRFRTAMLSWDNTARRQNHAHIYTPFSLQKYKQWLSSLCIATYNNPNYSMEEKLVFINAWNEWAEGSYLEPDQKYGYGYLQVTREVVEQYDPDLLRTAQNSKIKKTTDLAIIAHVHYEEVWPELCAQIQAAFPLGCDLFVSITSSKYAAFIRRDFPQAYIILVENRGRDILPFLRIFKSIYPLKYLAVCKVHTKKSRHREDGEKLRKSLFQGNLGSASNVSKIKQMFAKDKAVGLACPENFLLPHSDHNMHYCQPAVNHVAKLLDLKFKYSIFPAGSMFWFRPKAILKLMPLEDSVFPLEEGFVDGTPAHAVERLFAEVATSSGYTVKKIPVP